SVGPADAAGALSARGCLGARGWPIGPAFAIAWVLRGRLDEPKMIHPSDAVSILIEPGWADIREGVARICEQYPNAYWIKLDHASAYPHEFVDALTQAGYLAALIPEEYGGAGLPLSAGCAILETIHERGGNAAACHAQMYTMGTVL